MMPKLACADYAFPLLPFDGVLDLIAGLEFDGVDIGLFAGSSHVDPDHVLPALPASANELASRVQDRGLVVADIFLTPATDFYTLAPNHPDAGERHRSREIFRRALDLTVRWDAKHITALPGAPFTGSTLDENMDRAAEELAWRVQEAATADVMFAVEPHIGSIIPTPATTQALLDSTPGLTLSLDWAHMSSEGIPDADIESLLAHTSHFHARCAQTADPRAAVRTGIHGGLQCGVRVDRVAGLQPGGQRIRNRSVERSAP
jgi:sugar phosphate isomerase/epimerase